MGIEPVNNFTVTVAIRKHLKDNFYCLCFLFIDNQMLVSSSTELAPLYYKAGNVYKLRDMKPEAIECYQTILENFSDTALAPKARAALEELGVTVTAPAVTEETASEEEGI